MLGKLEHRLGHAALEPVPDTETWAHTNRCQQQCDTLVVAAADCASDTADALEALHCRECGANRVASSSNPEEDEQREKLQEQDADKHRLDERRRIPCQQIAEELVGQIHNAACSWLQRESHTWDIVSCELQVALSWRKED